MKPGQRHAVQSLSSSGSAGAESTSGGGGPVLQGAKLDGELRALALSRAGGMNAAAVQLDDVLHDRQTDSWAKPFMQSKKWDEAIGVIEKGLARFPGNKHLQHNLKHCQQQRGK